MSDKPDPKDESRNETEAAEEADSTSSADEGSGTAAEQGSDELDESGSDELDESREDEEDELEDEDEDEDEEPAISARPVTKSEAPIVNDRGEIAEHRVNAPSMQTIGMLGAVSLLTLICWGAGRAACNYHVPGEGLSPRETSLEERTKTPKDVALELQQRWVSADFEVAEKLVAGKAAELVQKDKKDCKDCGLRRAAEILSTAEVLSANPVDMFVRVRSAGAPGGEQERVFEVERQGQDWKVTQVFEAGAELPPLKEPPPGMGLPMQPQVMPGSGKPIQIRPGQLPTPSDARPAPPKQPVPVPNTPAPNAPAPPNE